MKHKIIQSVKRESEISSDIRHVTLLLSSKRQKHCRWWLIKLKILPTASWRSKKVSSSLLPGYVLLQTVFLKENFVLQDTMYFTRILLSQEKNLAGEEKVALYWEENNIKRHMEEHTSSILII